jgi:translation initiation factor 2 beta subunit (eIF-2beta)/eIF-5
MTAILDRKKSSYRCPECGSYDTELKRLGAEGRMEIFDKILDLLPGCGSPLRGGQYTLVCRSCGKHSTIFIR